MGGASLTTPPLGSLPEGGRGRPATPKPQLPGRAGPRRPERPGRPATSALAPSRPLYRPKPLPRQRGLHGPLLLILSRRHRPSVAETGTSSAPGRWVHKGAAAFSARPAGRWSIQRRIAPTPLPAYPARGPGAGRGCVLACGGGEWGARYCPRPMGGCASQPWSAGPAGGCGLALSPPPLVFFRSFECEQSVQSVGGLAFSRFAPRQSADRTLACLA